MRRRCHPSDTTSAEWALIEPLLPPPACETPGGGRPEKHPRCDIVDAIRYVVDTGCKWRALPRDFPPCRTVYGFIARWAAAGVIGLIRPTPGALVDWAKDVLGLTLKVVNRPKNQVGFVVMPRR